jgi:hypothetical protein
MFSKRGLSDIVTNVLIILLVLVAIGIIWAFIRPTIQQGAGSIDKVTEQYGTTLGIEPSSVTLDSANSKVSLVVNRNSGTGTLAGFNLILEDASGVSKLVRNNTQIGPLEARLIVVNYAGLGIGQPVKISVAPIFVRTSGEEIPAAISASANVPTSTSSAPCTDGNTQSCDATSGLFQYIGLGNQTCSGGAWNGCSTTLSCGDNMKNGTEQCDQSSIYNATAGTPCNYQGNSNWIGGSGTCNSCAIACNQCQIDFNNDNAINAADSTIFNDAWNAGDGSSYPKVDINGDGFFGGDDFDAFSMMYSSSTKYCSLEFCCSAGNACNGQSFCP